MKHPKVGEILYAASDKQDRVGETIFLTITQNNAGKSLKDVLNNAKELLCYPNEAEYDDTTNTWKPVFEKEREKDIIIYELKRIK